MSAPTRPKRYYIGLAATQHDPAIAIVSGDGRPLFAEAVERPLQSKRAFNCPPDDPVRIAEVVDAYCEPDGDIVGAVSWSTRHLAALEQTLPPYPALLSDPGAIPTADWPLPHPLSLLVGLRNSISQAGMNLWASRRVHHPVVLKHYDHHLAHAATAAYTSPYRTCAVAVVDGFGEGASTAFFDFRDGRLTRVDEPPHPLAGAAWEYASLGMFYAQLCALCGFDPLEGEEWKVMGLASYGEPDEELYDLLSSVIRVEGLVLRHACSQTDLADTMVRLEDLAGARDGSPLARANVAHAGQRVFEDAMTRLLSNLYDLGLSENLAFAGGCALNSSFNGRICERTPFRSLHVPSAPADDGNALGAALLACADDRGALVPDDARAVPYLGSPVDATPLGRLVSASGLRGLIQEPSDVSRTTARLLAKGKIVAWVQGHAEFGPRALGNRSILADPRSAAMRDRVNRLVKGREDFRPLAPAILDEHGAEYFERYEPSRYMERTLRFRPEARARVPAVVHVDGTGRLQSVRREWNPRFHDLLRAFLALTGVPVLLNTSLNARGKPIVHTLEDCFGLFITSELDALVVDTYLVQK